DEQIDDALGVGHEVRRVVVAVVRKRKAIGGGAKPPPHRLIRLPPAKEHDRLVRCLTAAIQVRHASEERLAGFAGRVLEHIVEQSLQDGLDLGPAGTPAESRSSPSTARSPISTGSRKAMRMARRYADATAPAGGAGSPSSRSAAKRTAPNRHTDRARVRPVVPAQRRNSASVGPLSPESDCRTSSRMLVHPRNTEPTHAAVLFGNRRSCSARSASRGGKSASS